MPVLIGETSGGGNGGVDGLGRRIDPRAVRRALEAAGASAGAGPVHVVLVSSAFVYGGWPDNPVPITEDASLRPEARNGLAVACGEAERLVDEWRAASPGRSASILRPTIVVHEEQGDWLARSPWGGRGPAVRDPAPSRQFLHIADLVTAIRCAADQRFDGVLNVAPDGWLPADQVHTLAGPAPRFHLPEAVGQAVQRFRWSKQQGASRVPFDGVLPYLQSPFVVANSRLGQLGWVAGSTNEEAFVAATPVGAFTGMSPKRRQMLSLGMAGGGILGAVGLLLVILRRSARAVTDS